MRFDRKLTCLMLLPLLLLGCGKSGPKVAPVSGRVMLDKKPLANADIVFSPTEANADKSPQVESSSRTDAEGRYTLLTNDDKRKGALLGAHKVRISQMERGTTLTNRLPKTYNENTILTFTVTAEGTTEANFDLTKDGRGK